MLISLTLSLWHQAGRILYRALLIVFLISLILNVRCRPVLRKICNFSCDSRAEEPMQEEASKTSACVKRACSVMSFQRFLIEFILSWELKRNDGKKKKKKKTQKKDIAEWKTPTSCYKICNYPYLSLDIYAGYTFHSINTKLNHCAISIQLPHGIKNL